MTLTQNNALRKESERLEEDVLYAEKQHFSMASVWRNAHLALGIPSAALAAIASISAVSSYPTFAAVLAICSAIMTSLLTFLDPQNAAKAHHEAGIKYSALRGRLRRLREIDLLGEESIASSREQLEELATEKASIMANSPHIGGLAYQLGKASIARGEHRYAVDSEIARQQNNDKKEA